jgi:two-component system cell cycle sensor histidine kinase/response regulator CckA
VVADTGPGMDRKILDHIFEPFFSTKGMTGTGLGLWISQEILSKHQGFVQVRSRQQPTHGTVFRIFLPFAAEKIVEQEETELRVSA